MELLCRLTLLLSAVTLSLQDKLPGGSGGGCVEGGKLVAEGSLVPQSDPCHVCHCHRGRIECFWKSCAPPPHLCEVMQLEDRCNPSLYVCPIPDSIADAPLRTAQSQLTETRRPGPGTQRPQVSAPARSRARSRSRSRSRSRVRSSNSASAPATAAKLTRTSSRRRRPTTSKPPAAAQPVSTRPQQAARSRARSQARSPQPATRSQARSRSRPASRSQVRSRSRPASRSQVRSRSQPVRRGSRRQPSMKIQLGPPVLPLVQPVDSFLPPPPPPGAAIDSAVAASALSGATYFNEELSVPHNFTMPQGRGDGAPQLLAASRSPQQLAPAVQKRKPFRFGPSQPKTPRAEAVSVQPVTGSSQPTTAPSTAPTSTSTPVPTPTPTPASTPAPRPTRRTRVGRRRGSSRGSSARPPPSPRQSTARRVPTPPRVRPARPSLPSVPTPSRRPHSRAQHVLGHETEPLMTFDYDLEEEIDLSDFMFPEFGRRLRRAVPDDEVFDAAAVRRLEAEWSARRRRRRSLLPGDGNHVHGHHHDEHAEHAEHIAEHAKSCSILGVKYELGEVIGVASDNCLECRCAAQAMFCSPKCCFFSLEERVFREGRQRRPDDEPPRPHPLQALITQ